MIQLSASKLNVLKECKRCFWDANTASLARPRGAFPSLPGGMDGVLKTYFDQYRGSIPPRLVGKVPGILLDDQPLLKKWRNWRTGMTYIDNKLGVRLIGALDDCLLDGELYIPLDYKTKGSEPKDDGSQYYQIQLNVYNLMLKASGYKIAEKAFLVYVYPVKIHDGEKITTVEFAFKPYEIACSSSDAKDFIKQAVDILNGPRPESASTCEHCNFALGYAGIEKSV